MGKYSRFPGLAFVDTLDNMEWQQKGATKEQLCRGRQRLSTLGGLSVG